MIFTQIHISIAIKIEDLRHLLTLSVKQIITIESRHKK